MAGRRARSQIDFNRNISVHQSILDHCTHTCNRWIFRIYADRGEKRSQHLANLPGEPLLRDYLLVMVIAALSTNIYEHKVSSAWIFGSYGVFTISELFMSPVGLSLVSKVAPRRFTALMMGGWFITTSLGGKIAGIMTGFWDHFDSKALFFGISAAAALVAGLAAFPANKKTEQSGGGSNCFERLTICKAEVFRNHSSK